MTKKTTIFVSVLCIIAAVLIEIFLKNSNAVFDKELVSFFQGALFAGGILMLLRSFIEKKK